MRYSSKGFLHKLDLYEKVTWELGEKIQKNMAGALYLNFYRLIFLVL